MLSTYFLSALSRSLILMTIEVILFQFTESTKCLKRASIAEREGNEYQCDHPVYSECCEKENRFTCCEPAFFKNLHEQLQLWGTVAVILAVAAFLYSCYHRDQELIRSDTLKEAVNNIGHTFGLRSRKSSKQEESSLTREETTGFYDSNSQTSLNRDFYNV